MRHKRLKRECTMCQGLRVLLVVIFVPEKTEIKIPVSLSLYGFQRETVEKTIYFLRTTKTHSCYVASEMGLGKSITSIVAANTLSCKRILIVCPAIMRLVWEAEIKKWSRFTCNEVESVAVISSSSDLNEAALSARWIIISYALLTNEGVVASLIKQKYSLLILDEAHYIKNARAKRTKVAIKELFPVSYAKLLLSGTPMTKSVTDLFVPFKAILPDVFPRFLPFAEEYSYKRVTPWATEWYGLKNEEKLSRIMRDNFYIRYKKQDVLKELPPKVFTDIRLPEEYSVKLSDSKAQLMYEEVQKLKTALEEGRTTLTSEHMAAHRRLQGVVKVPAVVDFAEELLAQEIPIVIFAWHKDVILALTEKLVKYNPGVITGATLASVRQAEVAAFQSEKTNLIICNILAAGVGITLSRANHVLMAEVSYSPADNSQATARAHRIGTKGVVNVYTFTAINSMDEDIMRIIVRKTKEFDAVCDEAA